MDDNRIESSNSRFADYHKQEPEQYLLQLYITGATPRSCQAVASLKKFCDQNLQGFYKLEVIDIYEHPDLARQEQIIATPTLIKKLPLPRKIMVGDLSNQELIKRGLGITSSSRIEGNKVADDV